MPGRSPEANSRSARTLILGVGNLLLGDEGFGVHAIRRLRDEGVPGHVVLEDGGTGGVDLLDMITAYDRVIVLDVIRPALPVDSPAEAEDGPTIHAGVIDLEDRGSGALGGPASGGEIHRSLVPGVVVVFRLNRVELLNPDLSLSLHNCSLGGLIRLANALNVPLPDIEVVGTTAERVAWTTELSPSVERAVTRAVAQIRKMTEEQTVEQPTVA
jgi:Ni,Fe-hydrogenase maturation factor